MRSFVFVVVAGILFFSQCQNSRTEGEWLYNKNCSNCHGDQGQGLGELIPALAQADYPLAHLDELPCLLRQGLKDTIIVNGKQYYDQPMPANKALSDIQITNILNYVGHSWGNQWPDFELETVRQQILKCE